MRRVVAALIVGVLLIQASWIADAQGQTSCDFKLGFATLRDLVGAQKIGACLEDEHFNQENGNSEQHTTGGLLVWRKVDNFTAFTDGGTTWVNGPNGLQSRPNSERFAWERDPMTAPSSGTTASSSPTTSSSPRAGGSPVASINNAANNTASGEVNILPDLNSSTSATANTPTKAPTKTPSATATPSPTATSAATPTKTPNPVSLKFTDKPDSVDTGSDVHIEVETNAKKATCSLTITYHNSSAAGIGSTDVDNDKCEWKFNVPEGTKTGKAKASVTVTGENGTTTTDEDFDVNEGDTFYTGDVNIDLELKDFPDEAKPGDDIKISVQSSIKNRGTCSVTINWPKVAATGGESKTPDDKGKCDWTITVPTTITKRGTATATITVQNRSGVARAVSKDFDVKLP